MTTPLVDSVFRCRAAQRAWADVPLRDRLRGIRRLRHRLVAEADRLCLSVTQDIGRPAPEVLSTDVLPTVDALRYLERHAGRILRRRRVPGRLRPWWLVGERETIHRRPLGIVGIIGTWNYPILLNAISMAQGLAAGNGILWKPSELTPTLAGFLHGLFLEAGFPPDLLVRLPVDREYGAHLVEADIDHLIFTGSANVGRRVAARLAERLIPCTLELSGCDAMFVLPDADPVLAARAAWFGFTINVGQTCLAVRRMIVHRSLIDPVTEELRRLGRDARPEPLALPAQAAQAESLIREALERGARLINAEVPPRAGDDPPRFPPTIVGEVRPEMAICREAAFSPVLAVLPFDDEETLATMDELCPYALGASIFTSSRARGEALARRLQAGSVSINDLIVGTAHPAIGFGGRRSSGWGVTRGEEGLLSLTAPQVVTRRLGRFRPHYDAGNPAIHTILRGLMLWGNAPRWRVRWHGLRTMLAGSWSFLMGRPSKPASQTETGPTHA